MPFENFDWKALVRTVAPAIGTALGGPVGGLAVQAISNALLGTPDAPEEEIALAVARATPEQLLALKKADQDFAKEMRALDIDLERIAAGDRDSARKREAATGDKITPRVLAVVVVGGFLGMVAAVLLGKVSGISDPVAAGMIGTLIGYVSAKADQVVSYYFGSSAGSAAKNATLDKLAMQKGERQ
jgi:uncharacterized membrane protein YeaQ/YmgE (transglycosylase-associated protein family)